MPDAHGLPLGHTGSCSWRDTQERGGKRGGEESCGSGRVCEAPSTCKGAAPPAASRPSLTGPEAPWDLGVVPQQGQRNSTNQPDFLFGKLGIKITSRDQVVVRTVVVGMKPEGRE